MTVNEFLISLGFQVNESSKKKAESGITEFKNFAKKAIGVIGISLSLSNINQLLEEWNQVNKVLNNVNTNLASAFDVQNYVTEAANACGMAYTSMADTINSIVRNSNSFLKTAEDAADFLTTANQLFQVSGMTTEQISSLDSALSSCFTSGFVSAGAFNTIMNESPELVSMLSEELGISEQRVKALGLAGEIQLTQLNKTLQDNAETIAEQYEALPMTISQAITEIKNMWGTWLEQLNETYGITDKIARFLVSAFKGVMGVLDSLVRGFEDLSDALGSTQAAVSALATAFGVLWAFNHADKIAGVITKIAGWVASIGTQTAAQAISNEMQEKYVATLKQEVAELTELIATTDGLSKKELEETMAVIQEDNAKLAGIATTEASEKVSLKDAIAKYQEAKGTKDAAAATQTLTTAIKAFMKQALIVIGIIAAIALVLQDLIAFANGDDSMIGGIFEALGIDATELQESLKGLYDVVMQILDAVMPLVETLIDSGLSVVAELLKTIFTVAANLLNAILPSIAELLETIEPIIELISTVLQIIVTVVSNSLTVALEGIGNMIGDLIQSLSGLLDMFNLVLQFIQDVFMGDWEDIGNDLANIFIGAINTVISGFESLVNFFIDGINMLTQNLSSIWTWLGIPAIPQIPDVSFGRIAYLAQGGYVQANHPTPVVIGDNPTEGEIVAPESKLREAVKEALELYFGAVKASASGVSVPMQTMSNQISNVTINQTVAIYNTFNGGTSQIQQNASKAINGASEDLAKLLANAMAYSR